jgi:ubiquinone/menaquinone biosynthesis C-methylase UbiE
MVGPNPVPYRDPDTSWRSNAREIGRADILMSLVPGGETVLDAGARDGYFSKLLAERYRSVVALDLEAPIVDHERVRCVAGDLTALDFPDGSFDCVFCTEVLEHVPEVEKACREIRRVARKHVIIGVPFQQDLRSGRMMCRECGRIWNAWKHLHSFTQQRLFDLFPSLKPERVLYSGSIKEGTNFLSAALMRIAKYPSGSYNCVEPCTCGAVIRPPDTGFVGKLCAGMAYRLNWVQDRFTEEQKDTINVLFSI